MLNRVSRCHLLRLVNGREESIRAPFSTAFSQVQLTALLSCHTLVLFLIHQITAHTCILTRELATGNWRKIIFTTSYYFIWIPARLIRSNLLLLAPPIFRTNNWMTMWLSWGGCLLGCMTPTWSCNLWPLHLIMPMKKIYSDERLMLLLGSRFSQLHHIYYEELVMADLMRTREINVSFS